ncbi:MAG: sulfotransferase family protein [Rubritepida sp.]|jgi:hypothetical protein|nr:sulfotransferase family protein [Rubritepida sp.]MCU0944172.1 sulfotransferase family protein [Rubritepida sp.]
MAQQDLFTGRFDAFFDSGRAHRGLWFFAHVPKTAGSSLGTDLAKRLQPYANITIDHADRERPAMERWDEAVARFLAEHAEKPYRFASGHLQHRHTERIAAAVPGMRRFTVLRDPVARVVSDFRYQRTDMHPLAEWSIQRTPGLAEFMDLPGQRNRAAKHLVPAEIVRRERVADAVAYVEDTYDFVGLQEMFALSFRVITGLVDRPAEPTERKRVNTAPVEEGGRLTPELAEAIAARSPIDMALFRHFSERLEAVAAPLEAYLDRMATAA